MTSPIAPRRPRSVLLTNPYCGPLREMYASAEGSSATSWNHTTYRRHGGVPTELELERVLFRACQQLQGLAAAPPPPIPVDVPPSPAAEAASLTE